MLYLRVDAGKYALEVTYSPSRGNNYYLSNYFSDWDEAWPPNAVYNRMVNNSSVFFHEFNLQFQRRIAKLFKRRILLFAGVDGNIILEHESLSYGNKYYDATKAFISETQHKEIDNNTYIRIGISEQLRYAISRRMTLNLSFIEVINPSTPESLEITFPTLGLYSDLGIGYKL